MRGNPSWKQKAVTDRRNRSHLPTSCSLNLPTWFRRRSDRRIPRPLLPNTSRSTERRRLPVGVGGIWTHGGRRPLDGLPRSSLCRATRGGVTDFLQVRDQVQAIARFGHTVICHRRAGDHLQRTCQKVVHLPFGPDDPRALHRRRVVEPRNAAGCRLARSCCRLGISNHARYPTVNMGLRPSHAMRGDRNAFGECRGAHARIDARLFEAGFFFSFRQANQPI
jgi:hypothetical protein